MAFSITGFSTFATISPNTSRNSSNILQPFISFPQFSKRNTSFGCRYGLLSCYAAAKQQRSGAPPATKRKKKPSSKNNSKTLIEEDFKIEKGGSSGSGVEVLESPSQSAQLPYSALPLPKPPAGFVLDEQGRVLMASNKRIATIVSFYCFISFLILCSILSSQCVKCAFFFIICVYSSVIVWLLQLIICFLLGQ